MNCKDVCKRVAVNPHLRVGSKWCPRGACAVPWYLLPPWAPASGVGPFQCPPFTSVPALSVVMNTSPCPRSLHHKQARAIVCPPLADGGVFN